MRSLAVRTLIFACGMLMPMLAASRAPQDGGAALPAQSATGTIRGLVTDPSGAVVMKVSVMAAPAPGQRGEPAAATFNKDGSYEIKGLVPATYSVSAVAQGFAPFEQANVQVTGGGVQKLDIRLELEQERQEVNVTGRAEALSVAPENNASAVSISGKDLDALSDDPDELQTELEALAGPAAGPNGG